MECVPYNVSGVWLAERMECVPYNVIGVWLAERMECVPYNVIGVWLAERMECVPYNVIGNLCMGEPLKKIFYLFLRKMHVFVQQTFLSHYG